MVITADHRNNELPAHEKMKEHKKINNCFEELREQLKELTDQYEKSENDPKDPNLGKLWMNYLRT